MLRYGADSLRSYARGREALRAARALRYIRMQLEFASPVLDVTT